MFLFPEISRNVSGNFWKPFPAVSRNIFPEISRKVQFEKKKQRIKFKKFLPKVNEGSYATTDLGNAFRGPNYLYGHTFREFSFANLQMETFGMCARRVVWSQTLCFFSQTGLFWKFAGKYFWKLLEMVSRFPETFLEISGNKNIYHQH